MTHYNECISEWKLLIEWTILCQPLIVAGDSGRKSTIVKWIEVKLRQGLMRSNYHKQSRKACLNLTSKVKAHLSWNLIRIWKFRQTVNELNAFGFDTRKQTSCTCHQQHLISFTHQQKCVPFHGRCEGKLWLWMNGKTSAGGDTTWRKAIKTELRKLNNTTSTSKFHNKWDVKAQMALAEFRLCD